MKPINPSPLPLLRELAARCRAAEVVVSTCDGVLMTTWPATADNLDPQLRGDMRDQTDQIRAALERRQGTEQ